MSANSTSPEILFGGTWEQLQDRFLIGASSTYTAGSAGGSTTNNTMNLEEDGNHPYHDGGNIDWHYRTVKFNKNFSIMPPYLAVYMWKRTK